MDPMDAHRSKVQDLEHEVQGIKSDLSGLKTDVSHLSSGQDVLSAKMDGVVNAIASLSAQKGTVSTGMIVSIVAVLISFATVVIGGGAFFHGSLLREIKENEAAVHTLEVQTHELRTGVAVNTEKHAQTKQDIWKWIESGRTIKEL